jgi:hypothetical protein
MSINAKLKKHIQEKEEEVEITIEHSEPLTAKQVATFFTSLEAILEQYGLDDARVVLSYGSLKTKIINKMFVGLASMLKNSYSKPQTEVEKKHVSKLINSLNNNNFSLFTINNNVLYNSKNIASKAEEIKKLHEKEEKENNITEEVETLEMKITLARSSNTKENKQGNVKEMDKFYFTAKFTDSRYKHCAEELKIITKDFDFFNNINLEKAHMYYFIADGILHKSHGKYIKFEITNLVKPPYLTKKLKQSVLF